MGFLHDTYFIINLSTANLLLDLMFCALFNQFWGFLSVIWLRLNNVMKPVVESIFSQVLFLSSI